MSLVARRVTLAVVALHGLLLLASLPDYFVSADSGYHVSLARWYGEHGTAWWDHISYGPGGRPNLQGPLMHMGVGYLGRILGGDGMDYVHANAVLGLAQWAAAVFTVWFFARRFGGDWAALFSVALFTGSLFCSISFAVGVPSGWVFVLSAWAAWWFVEEKLTLAVAFTSAAIYTHLAGYAMAPVAVFVAAVLSRRWRALAIVGVAAAVVTSPYTIHFLRHLEWYRGKRGDEALMLAPLIYIPAAVAIFRLLREPRKHVFLLAWLAAPAAWIVQDYKRFLLQAPLVLAVIAGIELGRLRERIAPRMQVAFVTCLAVVATVFPLNQPALAFEVMRTINPASMRFIDWTERKQLAEVIGRAGLAGRLVSPWNTTEAISMAVFVPMAFEGGHWVEVQPPVDPARRLSAGVKVYALTVPADDSVVQHMARLGFVTLHGGTALNAIVTLNGPVPLDEAARNLARIGGAEADWLAKNSVNNRMPGAGEMLSPEAIARSRKQAREQRTRVGRIEAAILVYAYALERDHADLAGGARRAADSFGELANRIGDQATRGMRSEAYHTQLQANLAEWARAAGSLERSALPTPELDRINTKLFRDYFR